jgi:hypothetical protein
VYPGVSEQPILLWNVTSEFQANTSQLHDSIDLETFLKFVFDGPKPWNHASHWPLRAKENEMNNHSPVSKPQSTMLYLVWAAQFGCFTVVAAPSYREAKQIAAHLAVAPKEV